MRKLVYQSIMQIPGNTLVSFCLNLYIVNRDTITKLGVVIHSNIVKCDHANNVKTEHACF